MTHHLNNLILLIAFSAAVSLAGCQTATKVNLGIPSQAQLVGGGQSIEFTAPADGTLFLVDQNRLVLSRSIRRNQTFFAPGRVEISPTAMHELVNARLYFLAAPAQTPVNSIPDAGPGNRTAID
jgi:hypothetical protein